MTAACNFIYLGKKCVNYWIKMGKERKKEKRKITDHMIGQKNARNLRVVSQCCLAKLNESWKNFYRSTRCE